MIRWPSAARWRALGVSTLRVTLGISGAVLNTTGHALTVCGRHAQALRTITRAPVNHWIKNH